MVVVNLFIRVINSLFGAIGSVIDLLLLAFPPSPFTLSLPSGLQSILGKANYFLPVNEMVLVGEAWLVAVGVFYLYSVYARWAKTIE